jgi:hypothetical protein
MRWDFVFTFVPKSDLKKIDSRGQGLKIYQRIENAYIPYIDKKKQKKNPLALNH